MTARARAFGLVAGFVMDQLVADPQQHHPVAWFGSWAGWVERRMWADSRGTGVAYVGVSLLPVAAAGALVERATRHRPALHAASTAVVTWAVLGASSLAREGQVMASALEQEDLTTARGRLSHLCGRQADGLGTSELARASVESLAENTADAAVASMVWGAACGIPGLMVHRAANTLDAMVGHRTARYNQFGWAAAHVDDLMDYLPARLTGLVTVIVAPLVGGSARGAWRVMRRDHAKHPSPNGGWCEAAYAGALGVQLGGTNVYASGVEERGLLGEGPRPGAAALRQASQLVPRVTAGVTALAVAALVMRSTRKAGA